MSQVLKMLEKKMNEAQAAGNYDEYERLSDLWQSLALGFVEDDLFGHIEITDEERERNGRILERFIKK